jgi:hypothetical protein
MKVHFRWGDSGVTIRIGELLIFKIDSRKGDLIYWLDTGGRTGSVHEINATGNSTHIST